MKIVHLAHHFSPCLGGIESFTLDLCRQLVKRGHTVRVVCLDRCPHSGRRLPASSRVEGIEIRRVPFVDFRFYKFAPAAIKWVGGFDVVHVQNIGFLSDAALLTKPLHRKPVVINTHGGFLHTKKLSLIKALYLRLWMPLVLKLADITIADSRHDFALFSRAAKNLRLVENGVELEKFLQLKRRAERGSFVFVGRLSENKRVDRLLRAFSFLKKGAAGRAEFRLLVVGEDFHNIMGRLKAQAGEMGIAREVQFTGRISGKELLDALSRAEFFVSASEYEGFGISAIEAMASGVIPVLNSIPTFREFVKQGENGFIVDFSKPELAAAEIAEITRMAGREKSRISQNARESAKRFDWKKRAGDFEKVYESAARQ